MKRVPGRAHSSFLIVAEEAAPASPPHQAIRVRFRAATAPASPAPKRLRLAALALLGGVVGIGGAVVGVSLVQAGDRNDVYDTIRYDDAQRQARRAAVVPVSYTSQASAYAPAHALMANPLAVTNGRGAVAFPEFSFNPFNAARPQGAAPHQRKAGRSAGSGFDTVSGASNLPRSICVRLCDGYQHPIAPLRDSADLPGHEALCTAMFPGVPTRVFRVAAGADTIDDATGPDGKTYRALPMAYAYQSSIDPACARPRTGQQTVAVMKDFTLRPGDTVLINGRPRVFEGAASYPYSAANFRDFRSTSTVTPGVRQQIDLAVGVSRRERLEREARQLARVREASAGNANRASDARPGGLDIAGARAPARIIDMRAR